MKTFGGGVQLEMWKLRTPAISVIILLLFSTSGWCGVESLESPRLRLELNTNPYSYRVIEKSSGQVLVAEDSLAVSLNGELYPVSNTGNVVKSPDGLQTEVFLQLAGRDALASGAAKTAHVSFRFINPRLLQVQIDYDRATEISESFKDQGEHYYGIWEYPFGGNIDNRGADQDFRGLGNERYVHHASVRAPFYVTSGKYGIYVESLSLAHYAIAQAGHTSLSFKGSQLKYNVIYGPSYSEVLRQYNELAGPAFMPPLWAFGTIWWRDDEHEDLRGVANAQEKVLQDADRLRALHIPAGAIWLDRPYGTGDRGWGNMDFDPSFPDPPKMIRDLDARGMKLFLWNANRCSSGLFQEGSEKGYLFPLTWPAADIQRPEVYKWFKDKLNAYVRAGIKGYKIDRGEEAEVPPDVENQFSVLFPKLSAEGMADAYGTDFFLFSRNVTDIGRKYTSVWNGDSWSTFEGLQTSIKTGIRSGIINFPMWGSDTGGYFAPAEKNKELLARWLEFSAFSPMMEVILGPKRTLWDDYDEELVAIGKRYASLHHDLIPYTRSYMYQATQTGMPIMRPLIFAFPEDQNLSDKWDEYLYGDDLLVAPVSNSGATTRDVYLPAGRWINYNEKRTSYEGQNTIAVSAPLGTIPVFVREGAIIPRGDIVQLNNDWEAHWAPKIQVEIFLSDQLGSRFSYFNGSEVREISSTPEPGKTIIHLGDLGTPGTVKVYCKNAKRVMQDGIAMRLGTDYQYDETSRSLTIPFHGATSLTLEGASSVF